MDQLLFWVGLAAVAVNAISGVLEAEDKRMDLLGAIMVALATALGGGSLRDVLVDRPVFWIVDQTYLAVGIIAAVATFFWARRRKISPNLILYPDAIGLAVPGMPAGSPGMDFPGVDPEPYEAFLFGPTTRSFGRFLGSREI